MRRGLVHYRKIKDKAATALAKHFQSAFSLNLLINLAIIRCWPGLFCRGQSGQMDCSDGGELQL